MRKIFIILAILASVYYAQAQENRVFYYHKGEKIYLDKVEDIKVIHFYHIFDD